VLGGVLIIPVCVESPASALCVPGATPAAAAAAAAASRRPLLLLPHHYSRRLIPRAPPPLTRVHTVLGLRFDAKANPCSAPARPPPMPQQIYVHGTVSTAAAHINILLSPCIVLLPCDAAVCSRVACRVQGCAEDLVVCEFNRPDILATAGEGVVAARVSVCRRSSRATHTQCIARGLRRS
jgi:hypothetical protein